MPVRDPVTAMTTTKPAQDRKGHSRQTARMALVCRLILSDALSILIGFSLARRVRGDEWLRPDGIDLMWAILPIFLVVAIIARGYSLSVMSDYFESARRAVVALVQTFLLLFAILFATQTGDEISRIALFVSMGAIAVPMLGLRYLSALWVNRTLGNRLFDDLLIIDGVPTPAIPDTLQVDAAQNGLRPDLDDPALIERFALMTEFYDRVIVACPPERQVAWSIMLKSINATGELLVGGGNEIGAIGLGSIGTSRTLVVSRGGMALSDRFKKRMFDLAVAVPALIMLAPMLLIVAIGIKLDSPGPVFFRQPRVGRNNVMFRIFKFRSMRQDSCDVAGAQSTRRDDDRISRFGAFLRKTSIDELPQLLNVIKGDMSIVGPRPHALGSTADEKLFWEISHRYWERHALKPGITGLAQVRGFRGATEKTDDLTNRLQADLEYLQDWRLWRDIGILFATLQVLVHPNAY